MEDQYGMPDLRQYMTGRMRPLFPPIHPPPPPPDLLSGHHHHHRGLTPAQNYQELVLVGRQVSTGLHHDFGRAAADSTTSGGLGFSGLEIDTGAGYGADGGTGRWPRQETLTLLEVRSRLDPKFKEANQKGPLWDEVSRIMSEEHGYQRSGKKCREKFENLYKYYKKTKEGKAGRQDGKHYRFFRQLEALYGETSSNAASASDNHPMGRCSYRYNATPNQELGFQVNNNPKEASDSLSHSRSSADFDSTSSEDINNLNEKNLENIESSENKRRGGGRRTWKAKIKDYIDLKMRKLMEKQEEWLEKMMSTIERKEQERELREEEWRKQETSRIDREQKFWANERAWIEARDATLMETLRKFTRKELVIRNDINGNHDWEEFETTRLIQLRTSMEPRFQQINIGGCPNHEQVLWEEIASKMVCLGYKRNGLMCKEKWDSITNYLIKCSKKRKENVQSDHQGGASSSPTSDGSYRYLMGDNENLWDNYGMKFNKWENH